MSLSDTTWTFKDTMDNSALVDSFGFGTECGPIDGIYLFKLSTGSQYTGIGIDREQIWYYSESNWSGGFPVYQSNSWINSAFKTITFLTEPEFAHGSDIYSQSIGVAWLEANATQAFQVSQYLVHDYQLKAIADSVREVKNLVPSAAIPWPFATVLNTIDDVPMNERTMSNGTQTWKRDLNRKVYIYGSGTLSSVNENTYWRRMSANTKVEASEIQIIGTYAFASCSALTSVNFPLCTTIEEYAFMSCSNLINIDFPACEKIYRHAFLNCPLSSINLPNCSWYGGFANQSIFENLNSLSHCYSLTDRAFESCSKLSTVELSECTYIGDFAFYGCSALISISFPICTTIGSNAFQYCSALTSVNFPACTSIRSQAFVYCSSLTTVNFPACTSIGEYAFYGCSALTTINFPACTTINSYAFQYCSALTSVNFPVCTSIRTNVFYNCFALTSVNFPVCTSIGTFAFFQCSTLTTVNFPACTSIGHSAFDRCPALISVNFPVCTSIGNYTFCYCSALISTYFLGSTYITLNYSNAFYSTPMSDSTYTGSFGSIYVPDTMLASYKTRANWSYYSDRLVGVPVLYTSESMIASSSYISTSYWGVYGSSCTTIYNDAFATCSNLTTAIFSSCTSIGSYAFIQCTKLTTIYFPKCTYLDSDAFDTCTALQFANFPSCISMSQYTFADCTNLIFANFPACTLIGIDAFLNCSALTDISFPVCSHLSGGAFESCATLSSINFPACEFIGSYAFVDCHALTSAYFLGTTYITLSHSNAFEGTPIQLSTYTNTFGSIYVRASMLSSYKTRANWSVYSSRFVGLTDDQIAALGL